MKLDKSNIVEKTNASNTKLLDKSKQKSTNQVVNESNVDQSMSTIQDSIIDKYTGIILNKYYYLLQLFKVKLFII